MPKKTAAKGVQYVIETEEGILYGPFKSYDSALITRDEVFPFYQNWDESKNPNQVRSLYGKLG
jgi:hypothetical protein